MPRADIRNDGRPVTVQHHSARGEVKRNSGNFTRGSQLLSHEVLMWFSGAKIPFLIWLGVFLLAYAIILALTLDENNIQLICNRMLSSAWDWVALDPMKRVNLRMPDDSVRSTFMGYVPYVPEVIRAWDKAVRGFIGSSLIASFLTIPLAIWYVDFSRRRGKNILEERHERGAMLVERDVLFNEIAQHNIAEFEKEARDLFPGHSPKAVLAMPFDARKAAGIHHPYSLAGIPFPHRLEQSHVMLIGTTGAGKTTAMRKLIREMQERKDNAVIFDLTGAYVEAFFDPERDTILNPMDARCPAWTIFNDCTTYSEFTSAAAALIPSDGGSAEPFWAMAARTLFIEMCMKLIEKKQTSNRALSEYLMTADLKQVHKYLAKTIADPLTAPEAARMAESIRAVFNTNAQVLRFLPDDGEQFSIRDWMTRDKKPGAILFITSSYTDLEMNRALLTLWSNLAIYALMGMPRTRSLRTWFMFDELGALHRLPAIESGLQTARNFGGAMVLGLHSFDKLVQVYGEENARNLSSLARTKLILAAADLETAEQCSRYIGSREVRQMDEAYSYGYNNTRDASTLTPRKQVEPLVIPDDITNLPSMHGFVKFPDGFPAARIQLKWEHYATLAPGFVKRPPALPGEEFRGRKGGASDRDEGGGRDGAPELVEPVDQAALGTLALAAGILSHPSDGELEAREIGEREALERLDPLAPQARPGKVSDDTDRDRDMQPDRVSDAPQGWDRRESSVMSPAPPVEDQTAIELRQDFAQDDQGLGI